MLAVLASRDDYGRVVLALDDNDLAERRGSERDLAVAIASVAAAAVRGRALVLAPEGDAARRIAGLIGERS